MYHNYWTHQNRSSQSVLPNNFTFFSRKLRIWLWDTRLELLAIVEAFMNWRHYLEESVRTVTTPINHNNLNYFVATKQSNLRQARWSEKFSAFDFDIEYQPGTTNPASRRPDYDTSEEWLYEGLIVQCKE